MFTYKFEYGQLYLYACKEMVCGIPDNELAILYSIVGDGLVVHKHCGRIIIEQEFKKYLAKLDNLPEPTRTEMKSSQRMISFKVTPDMLEDINRILSTTGYLKSFFKKYGISVT